MHELTDKNFDRAISRGIVVVEFWATWNEANKITLLEHLTKKEVLTLSRAYEKLDRSLGGIRSMKKLPDAIFIIDVNYEKNAVQEAKALGITIISIVDSNSSPEDIDYIIPSNDDSRSTAKLFTETIV